MLRNEQNHNNRQETNGTDESEKLRRELKRVREENRKLKHIISWEYIDTLDTDRPVYGLQPHPFEKNRTGNTTD